MTGFGQKLVAAGHQYGRLCVGIDPHPELLRKWGLNNDVAGLKEFSYRCTQAFAGRVALVKPQVAFYEAYGSQGFAILEETIGLLRAKNTLVVADAKRGDIGSTMAGYAQAWLDDASPLVCDAVTVSPFLGFHSLDPIFDKAAETNRGVFVLAATSNPEARQLQDQKNNAGVSISQQIIDNCCAMNAEQLQQEKVGNVGVVVGATLAQAPELKNLNGPILLPGVGAQGGSAEDVARLTQGVMELGFPNISRVILQTGPDIDALINAVTDASACLG
ncbi:Orotidine 5-phosphate decarboxylase [Corynebacterium kutscheri]|uniref:Orotidine 5'-phosphate decarboxylase n=1 Tax=Corynebacterium kutscheri TaxID=35755 RepID=A0A0F6TD02_9CORY|nr:orotidine-5'-phosphate decarboxylase [Corynebacterium kutscheri]AKE41304.1 orotidine-5'-phosphate decarboxylase [Corynebacterium kutscheri]VEH08580.1 Orotidine 5-phosphate decarboxylase [Corynebacterium kutscheri]VEH09626.1 Orotidine 5-phosphate decarboxylase [Corynebacterium kutscheri]VEH79709.1 Orotidine 5-phosphate decarboxylase [Corynebacterium kutscheri]